MHWRTCPARDHRTVRLVSLQLHLQISDKGMARLRRVADTRKHALQDVPCMRKHDMPNICVYAVCSRQPTKNLTGLRRDICKKLLTRIMLCMSHWQMYAFMAALFG